MTNSMDKFGIWSSGLCALHCMMLPVLLPILPLLSGSFLAEHWFEESMIILSLAIGVLATLSGFFRYHRRVYPFVSLAVAAVFFWQKDQFGESFEVLMVVVGAALVIASHWINLRLCKSCADCETCPSN